MQVLTEKATPVLSSTPTISTTELESPYIEEPEEIVKSKSSDSLELKDSEDAFATVDFDEQATITIAPLSSFKSNSGNTSPKPSKKVHFLIEESPNNGGSDVTEADDDLEAGDDLEDRERETQFNHESFLRISEWNESATSLVPVPTMSLVPVPTEPIVENPVPVAQEADKDVFVINIPQAAVEAGDRETFSDFSDLTAARPGVEYPLPIVEETRPITPEAEDAIIDIAAEDWIKAEPADIEPRVGPRISVDEEEGLTSTTVGLPRRRWSIFRSFRSSIRAFKSPQRGQIDGPSATATRAASSTRDNAETLPRHSESIKSTRSTRSPLLRRISTKPLVNGIAHKAKQTRDAVFSAGAARKVWGFVKFLTGYGNPSTDAKTSGRGLHTIKARNHRSWVQDIADLEEGKAIVESKPTNTNQKTARHHRRVDSGVGFCEGEFAGDELSVQSLNEVVRLAVATATSKKTSPFSSSISFPAPAAVAAVRA